MPSPEPARAPGPAWAAGLWRGAGWALLAVAGTLLLVGFVGELRRAAASPGWPRASGYVTASEVTRDADGPPTLDLWYTYTVGGRTYHGTTLAFGRDPGGMAALRGAAARYPVGRAVRPYYAPGDPAVAVLEPGADRAARWNMAGGFVLGLAVCGVLAAACFSQARRRDRRPAA